MWSIQCFIISAHGEEIFGAVTLAKRFIYGCFTLTPHEHHSVLNHRQYGRCSMMICSKIIFLPYYIYISVNEWPTWEFSRWSYVAILSSADQRLHVMECNLDSRSVTITCNIPYVIECRWYQTNSKACGSERWCPGFAVPVYGRDYLAG